MMRALAQNSSIVVSQVIETTTTRAIQKGISSRGTDTKIATSSCRASFLRGRVQQDFLRYREVASRVIVVS